MTTKNTNTRDGAESKLLDTSSITKSSPEALADKVAKAVAEKAGYAATIEAQAQSKPLAALVSATLKYSNMTVAYASMQKALESLQKISAQATLGSLSADDKIKIDTGVSEEESEEALEKIIPEVSKLMAVLKQRSQEAIAPYKLAQRNSDESTPTGAAIGYTATNGVVGTLLLAQVGQVVANMLQMMRSDDEFGDESDEEVVTKLFAGAGSMESTIREFKEQREQRNRLKGVLDSFGQAGTSALEWLDAFQARMMRDIAMPQMISTGLVKDEAEYDAVVKADKAKRKEGEANMDQALDMIEGLLKLGSAAQKGELDEGALERLAEESERRAKSLSRK